MAEVPWLARLGLFVDQVDVTMFDVNMQSARLAFASDQTELVQDVVLDNTRTERFLCERFILRTHFSRAYKDNFDFCAFSLSKRQPGKCP